MECANEGLVERLHRLLVALEDEFHLEGRKLPSLAVYDPVSHQWLLSSRVSLARLDSHLFDAEDSGGYVMLAGATTTRSLSRDHTDLLIDFAFCARTAANAGVTG